MKKNKISIKNCFYLNKEFDINNAIKFRNAFFKEDEKQKIKIFALTTKVGPNVAKNYGALLSEGKYLMFNDSDDFSVPDRIEKLLTNIENDFVTSSWVTANNVTSIASSAVSDNTGTDVFSWIFQVMQTVGYYFFTMLALISPWNFGILPAWLSLIFNFMKLILVLTIARNVWIGGGG